MLDIAKILSDEKPTVASQQLPILAMVVLLLVVQLQEQTVVRKIRVEE